MGQKTRWGYRREYSFCEYSIVVGKPERDQLEDLWIHGSAILKRILNRFGGGGLCLSGPGCGQVAGCCELGDETLGSVKCGLFIDYLWNSASLEGLYSVELALCVRITCEFILCEYDVTTLYRAWNGLLLYSRIHFTCYVKTLRPVSDLTLIAR